jgi:hypothetical protein
MAENQKRAGPKPRRGKRDDAGQNKPASRSIDELAAEWISALEDCQTEVEQVSTESDAGWDMKDAARATVRSACVAAEQRFSRSKNNPLHAWEAIWMCTGPSVAPMPLPDWCAAYLHEFANHLLNSGGDGKALTSFISEQLGITKKGWNAFMAKASDKRSIDAALLFDELTFSGSSVGEAYSKVMTQCGFSDRAQARRFVKNGHTMLSHIPGFAGNRT